MSVAQSVEHKLERLLVERAARPINGPRSLHGVAQEAACEPAVVRGGVRGAKGVEDRLRDCGDELGLHRGNEGDGAADRRSRAHATAACSKKEEEKCFSDGGVR